MTELPLLDTRGSGAAASLCMRHGYTHYEDFGRTMLTGQNVATDKEQHTQKAITDNNVAKMRAKVPSCFFTLFEKN